MAEIMPADIPKAQGMFLISNEQISQRIKKGG